MFPDSILGGPTRQVRLRQLTSRIAVLRRAAAVTRPADLRPQAPLLLGGATSLCLHLLRKLGVTQILNCPMAAR